MLEFQGKPLYTSQDKPAEKKQVKQGKLRAIVGSLLIDGNGGQPVSNPVILLEGRIIKKVGTKETIIIPPGTETIDFTGFTIMPGLIDTHIHTCMFNCLTFNNYRVSQWEVTPELQQMYSLFHAQMCLDNGFTTLRDLGLNSSRGNLTTELCAVRDSIEAGIFPGPRMLIAGWATITGSHLDLVLPRAAIRPSFQTADGPWELRKIAREQLRVGCDVIKTCTSGGGGTDKEEPDVRNMTQEELDAIVDESHAFQKSTAVHCFTPQAQLMAVRSGADTIEHMVFNSDEAIEAIVKAGIYVTPTLSHRTDHAIDVRRAQGTSMFILDKMKTLQPFCYETFQKMHKAGVKIAMGTDMGYDPEMGEGGKELRLYVDLGMSPMEAIQVSTKHAADSLKLGESLGTINEGKIADLLAVKGNPAENIDVLGEKNNIKIVMRDGKVLVDRRPGFDKSAIRVDDKSWKIIDYL